jgi:hypothetical protein
LLASGFALVGRELIDVMVIVVGLKDGEGLVRRVSLGECAGGEAGESAGESARELKMKFHRCILENTVPNRANGVIA